ncbi:MAG: SLC13 family permease [Saprospiraceae bacterium]|nr:SLC13 family permease [Saprospiraceae bacterium]MDP4999509.1 SLC13 family permease [Saprospiraceae bacterium]
MKNTRQVGLILGPVLFFLIRMSFYPDGVSAEANAVFATTVWMAVWWITEAVAIEVTALLPVVLFPLTGALPLAQTTVTYGDKYVFLYMGGFMLAIAIEKWNLHRRIALNIIRLIGTDVKKIILGFMVATGFMSMWISNTATAVMMLPIAMAIVKQLEDNPDTVENENLVFGKALMLAIAYSASIGGIATLIGTPPNLVLASVVKELYGIEISFAEWMMVGLPIAVGLLFLTWYYLTNFAFAFRQKSFPGGREEINRQLKSLGKISYEEVLVLIVFVLMALAWITRSFLLKKWIPALDDTLIAMIGAIVLFMLPTKAAGQKILDWKSAVKLPWGILLLFGGGLALAEGFTSSGLADWIGGQMTLLAGVQILLLVLILVTAVNFLTEVTSNLATTAMLLPILAPMAVSINVHPYLLLVPATLAASCAFMLPVATPPNAVVFGSGYLRIPDMVRTGVALNVLSIIIVSLLVYFLLPLIWGFEPVPFPEAFKSE